MRETGHIFFICVYHLTIIFNSNKLTLLFSSSPSSTINKGKASSKYKSGVIGCKWRALCVPSAPCAESIRGYFYSMPPFPAPAELYLILDSIE